MDIRITNFAYKNQTAFAAKLTGADFKGKDKLKNLLENGQFKDYKEEFYVSCTKYKVTDIGLFFELADNPRKSIVYSYSLSQRTPVKKGCRGLILSTTVKDNPDFSPAEGIISYFERWYERKPLNDLRIQLGLEPKTNIIR